MLVQRDKAERRDQVETFCLRATQNDVYVTRVHHPDLRFHGGYIGNRRLPHFEPFVNPNAFALVPTAERRFNVCVHLAVGQPAHSDGGEVRLCPRVQQERWSQMRRTRRMHLAWQTLAAKCKDGLLHCVLFFVVCFEPNAQNKPNAR